MKLRLGILMGALPLVLWACDPGTGVTFVNETSMEVTVLLGKEPDAGLITTLAAGETRKNVGVLKTHWQDIIVVRNSADAVILQLELSWEELQDLEQIVIR